MKKNCEICGKPSGMYPLCLTHLKLKDEGKVVKCPNCGKWKLSTEKCNCQKNNDDYIDKSKCIICNELTEDNYIFCKNCYYKYKNKTIMLKIKNCKEIILLDDSYEGVYVCDDGHIVKSEQERDIDNYFFKKGIAHAYEPSYSIDNNPEHDIHPDFYLPQLDIYIEHWGYDESNKKYNEQKNYKMQFYKRDKITLICTTIKDMKNVNASLDRKLKFYNKNEINE